MNEQKVDPFKQPWRLPGLEVAQVADVRWWGQVCVTILSGWAVGSLWIAGHAAATTLHFLLVIGLAPLGLLLSARLQWGMRRRHLARFAEHEGEVRSRRLARMAYSYAEWPVFLVAKGISPEWKVRRVHPFIRDMVRMGQAQVQQLAALIPDVRRSQYQMMLDRTGLGHEEALRMFSEQCVVPVDGGWERCDPFVRMAVLPPDYRSPSLLW